MENIKWQDIGPNDYLLGKGGFLQEQVGNIRFRDGLINVLKPAYQSTRKTKEKQGIVKDIIQSWKHNGGRFLKQQDENDAPDDALWNDITDNVKLVEETIKQKLREKPKTKKKKKQKNVIVSPPVSPIPTAATVSVLAHDTAPPPFPLERATVAPDDPSLVAVYTNAVTPPHEMVDHNMIEDDDYNNHNIVENNNYQEEEQQKQLNQQKQQDDLKEQYRRLAMMAMHSHGILTVPDFMEENTQQQQEQQHQQNFLDLLSNVASEQELINLLQQNAPLPVEGRQVSVSHRSLTAPPAFMVESLKSVLSNMSEEEFVKVSTSCRNVYNNPTQGITRYYPTTTTEENNEINNNNTTTNGDHNGGHDRNIILQTTANDNNNVMTFQGIPPVNRYEETKQEEEEEIFSRSKSFSLSIADECALEMDTHIANGLEGTTLQQQKQQQQQQEYHIYDPQGDMAIQIGSIHSSAQMSLSDIEAHLNREADKQEAVTNEEGYLTSWIPSGLFHHDFAATTTTTRSATNKARRKRYVFIGLVVIIILMIVVIVLRLKDKNSKNE